MADYIPSPGEEEDEETGYTPASPAKRAMAWVGLAYAFLFLALTTYFFYTGKMLGNLAPLLALPGLIGLGAVALISYRTAGFPAKWQAIGIAVGCWLLAALTLPMAWVGLMSNFGG